ncbi:MAG: hypothetical protein HW421_1797 [Ignavibacteria bacterium]|nr:hypothetical protein [Ignavibacteria bacterium]
MKFYFLLIIFITLLNFSESYSQPVWEKTSGTFTKVNQLAINHKGFVYAAGGDGIFRTTNSGNDWIQLPVLDFKNIYYYSIICTKKDNIIAIYDSGIIRSSDDGESWHVLNNNFPTYRFGCLGISDNGRIYIGYDKLFFSDDEGTTCLEKDFGFRGIVSISTFRNKFIFIGTDHYGGSYFSNDTGNTFKQLPYFVIEQESTNSAFNNKGDLFINLNGYMGGDATYRSIDTGITFFKLASLNNTNMYFIRIDANDKIYIASVDKGVLISNDNGDSWTLINNGLNVNYPFYATDLCFMDINTAFLVIWGTGVFRCSNLTGVDESITNTNNTELLNITPNPASKQIEIQFNLENQSLVNLNITNLLGIEVAGIIDNVYYEQGNSSITFDTGNLSTGVYFCTLRTNAFARTVKFVVVR